MKKSTKTQLNYLIGILKATLENTTDDELTTKAELIKRIKNLIQDKL